jgi:hypothetical protein
LSCVATFPFKIKNRENILATKLRTLNYWAYSPRARMRAAELRKNMVNKRTIMRTKTKATTRMATKSSLI